MLKPVLLVEHNARDLELTLLALERIRLANVVVVVRNGVQALDFLLRRNDSADRVEGSPQIVLLDLNCQGRRPGSAPGCA